MKNLINGVAPEGRSSEGKFPMMNATFGTNDRTPLPGLRLPGLLDPGAAAPGYLRVPLRGKKNKTKPIRCGNSSKLRATLTHLQLPFYRGLNGYFMD